MTETDYLLRMKKERDRKIDKFIERHDKGCFNNLKKVLVIVGILSIILLIWGLYATFEAKKEASEQLYWSKVFNQPKIVNTTIILINNTQVVKEQITPKIVSNCIRITNQENKNSNSYDLHCSVVN